LLGHHAPQIDALLFGIAVSSAGASGVGVQGLVHRSALIRGNATGSVGQWSSVLVEALGQTGAAAVMQQLANGELPVEHGIHLAAIGVEDPAL
jgi:hypothetical protein